MQKMQPTFIDVMRHGEPEGVCPEGGTILRGRTDHALTDKGWLPAYQRAEQLLNDGNEWDVIISSPLIRCAHFAKALITEKLMSHPDCLIDARWREIDYGDWDGLSTAKIWQDSPELMEKMWQNPMGFCAPKGEAVTDFSMRIEQAWSDLLMQHQGKRILLVCHGGVMRLLLKQLLLLAPEAMNRFAIPYAAVSRFRIDHSTSEEGPALTWPSLVTHLGDAISVGKIDTEEQMQKNGNMNNE
jgi:alpha-ribazole phosphatase